MRDMIMNVNQIKEIIRSELLLIMQEDVEMREFVITIARTQFPDKKETESRFDRILNELRLNREEQSKKWEEQDKKWHEQDEKWHANQKTINELLYKINNGIGALGARWGILAEESFRNGLKGILEDSFDVEVLNVTEKDEDGEVFGSPDQVELDIIIKNSTLIICEIKSSMSRGDVYIFNRKIAFYEKRHNRKADRKIIISPMVDEYGRYVAKKLDMEVYSYSDEIKKL
jgi:hypothetical protein